MRKLPSALSVITGASYSPEIEIARARLSVGSDERKSWREAKNTITEFGQTWSLLSMNTGKHVCLPELTRVLSR